MKWPFTTRAKLEAAQDLAADRLAKLRRLESDNRDLTSRINGRKAVAALHEQEMRAAAAEVAELRKRLDAATAELADAPRSGELSAELGRLRRQVIWLQKQLDGATSGRDTGYPGAVKLP